MDFIEKLEMHYHLKEGSHSMNAIVRNKCEAEALAVFLEISNILGVDIDIESMAFSEGGLREIWNFMGKSNGQLSLILAVVILIFSRIPVSDPEMDALNKKIAKLTIEEKSLSIQKLKNEIESGSAEKETIDKAVSALEGHIKIAARRSNFYKHVFSYKKVTGVGLREISKGEQESYVSRDDFNKFVMSTNKLPVEVVESANIEIIAPVIKEGNYQWKGIYQGEPISFAMTDEEFKVSVLSRQVTFQHGTAIDCVLNIHRKFDEVGEVVITGYSVPTVISIADGVSQVDTLQGKRFRARKKFDSDQVSLF